MITVMAVMFDGDLFVVSSQHALAQSLESQENLPRLTSFVTLVSPMKVAQLRQVVKNDDTFDSLQDLKEIALRAAISVSVMNLNLAQLKERGGVAILHLRDPDQLVIMSALGTKHAFVSNSVTDVTVLQTRYTGEALLLTAAETEKVSVFIEEPIHIQKINRSGADMEDAVTIANRGLRPINIDVAHVSCGCTSAKLSSQSVPPGGSTLLAVKMQASGWGAKTETVTLRTDDSLQPRILVVMQALTPKSIIPRPEQMAISTREGKDENRVITVLLPEEVSVTSVKTQHQFLQAKLGDLEIVKGGSLQRINVSLLPNSPVGKINDDVTINLRNAEVPQIKVPVSILITPDVTLTPDQLFLGQIAAGTTVHKEIVVKSQNGSVFKISSVKSQSSNLRVAAQANPTFTAASHAVGVDISFQGKPGAIVNDMLDITLSSGITLHLPIVAMATPSILNGSTAPNKDLVPLTIGQAAPDFSVPDMNGNPLKLKDLKGKNVILTFFPKCFTGGCAEQLASLQSELVHFQATNTQIVAVSVDSATDQLLFSARLGLNFSLIPDSEILWFKSRWQQISWDRTGFCDAGVSRLNGPVYAPRCKVPESATSPVGDTFDRTDSRV